MITDYDKTVVWHFHFLFLSLGWAYLSHSAEATYWAHGATVSVCVCVHDV